VNSHYQWRIQALLLAFATACGGTKDDESTTGEKTPAIEITGYLDGDKVSWSSYDDLVIAAGTEDAASAGSSMTLTNLDIDIAPTEGTVADDGSFSIDVTGTLGDNLVLEVTDAPEEEQVHYEVTDLPPFPETESVHAVVDPHHDGHALVEVVLTNHEAGWIVASNPRRHVAVELSTGDSLVVHQGLIAGMAGEWLVLHWMTGTDASSGAIEVEIRAAD